MELSRQKELSAKLKIAMADEHLWSRDAGRLLNINPQYISMMLNERSFSKTSTFAWQRLEEWDKTGDKLSSFLFPAGEIPWTPSEKAESNDKKDKTKRRNKGISATTQKGAKGGPETIIPETENTESSGKKPDQLLIPLTTARLKVALDVEINLMVNGQRVRLE